MRDCRLLQCCEPTVEERSAVNPHATFCGSGRRATASRDPVVADGRMPRGRKIDGVVLWDVNEIREAWERLRDGTNSKNPFDGVVA
jgi:hypothetical protein